MNSKKHVFVWIHLRGKNSGLRWALHMLFIIVDKKIIAEKGVEKLGKLV